MAREQSPYGYQSPVASIGASLGRALFGDPSAAAAQAKARAEQLQRDAQAEEARAHARLYASQAGGVDIQNTASQSLPDLIASMTTPRGAPTDGAPLPAPYADGEMPMETRTAAIHRGLPAVLAAMGQMNGEHIDPRQIMGTLGAFSGDDQLARAGLIAQGHTPTKDFAIDPARADAIATQGFDAAHSRAVDVAATNHLTDVPVANIRAGASRDVATINNRDDIPVAQIAADSRANVAGIKGANALSSAIVGMYPGARISRGDSDAGTQERLRASGATRADWEHTNHNPALGHPAVDMAPIPGKSLSQFVSELQQHGMAVVEARDEQGGHNDGTGPHWHIAAVPPAGGRARAAPPAGARPPRAVSAAGAKLIAGEMATQFAANGGTPNDRAQTMVRTRAMELYQQSGNPAAAVTQAMREVAAPGHAVNHPAPAPPPPSPQPRATAAPSRSGPAVGAVQQGYRFKGGNPALPASWEKVR